MNKQIKLTDRTTKIMSKVQERRRLLFQDKLIYNPSDLAKQNHLLMEKFTKVNKEKEDANLELAS